VAWPRHDVRDLFRGDASAVPERRLVSPLMVGWPYRACEDLKQAGEKVKDAFTK
jgi:hypothetical protein